MNVEACRKLYVVEKNFVILAWQRHNLMASGDCHKHNRLFIVERTRFERRARSKLVVR